MTTITAAEANQLILDRPADFATKASFLDLVRRISVDAPGSVTLLYGQPFGQDLYGNSISSATLVNQFVSDGVSVRVINRTELAKFLDYETNLTLRGFFDRYFGDPDANGSPANHLLYDPTPEDGAWANGSKRFVEATVGEVITITPNATMDRVFGATELPAILDNPASTVTKINGFQRDDLVRARDLLLSEGKVGSLTEANQSILDLVNFQSRTSASLLEVVSGPWGGIIAVGTDKYFGRVAPSTTGTVLPAGMTPDVSIGLDAILSGSIKLAPETIQSIGLARETLQVVAQERSALAALNPGDVAASHIAADLKSQFGQLDSVYNIARAISDPIFSGKVTTLTGLMSFPTDWFNETLPGDSTQTRLELLLSDSKVQTIDGISRQSLIEYRDGLINRGKTLQEAFNLVGERLVLESHFNNVGLDVAINAHGEIVWVDNAKLFGDSSLNNFFPQELVTHTTIGELGGERFASQNEAYMRVYDSIVREGGFASTLGKAGSVLTVVGGGFAIYSYLETIKQAEAYSAQGDDVRAAETIRSWAVEMGGGVIGGQIGWSITVPIATALVGMGSLPVWAGVASVIGASLLAGYVGGQAAIWIDEQLIPSVDLIKNLVSDPAWQEKARLDASTVLAWNQAGTELSQMSSAASAAWEGLTNALAEAGPQAASRFLLFANGIIQNVDNIPQNIVDTYHSVQQTWGQIYDKIST
ncbi:MAG: hypothetical protein HQL95_14630, partial [Magnetococcales bacterium]|nr:hypothetical protein [Magnetococcales bacterium]